MKRALTLVLGTHNPGKAAEFRELLRTGGWPLADLREFPATSGVEENGSTVADNVRWKACSAATRLERWVLADDTVLEVDALQGAPGIYTARFAGPQATAEANRQRLLEQLCGVPTEQRDARFVCHLVLADPSGRIRGEAPGYCRGRIRTHAAGSGGFGYDSLFEIVEYHRTLAELADVTAGCLTHRAGPSANSGQPWSTACILRMI